MTPTVARPRHRTSNRWAPNWLAIGAAAVAWAGLLVFLYPMAASWFSQYNQSLLIESYSARVEEPLDPPAVEQLGLAREYNERLTSGAIVAAHERIPIGSGTSSAPDDGEYWSTLRAAPLDVMGRIRIPSIDVDLPIYHGTDDETLERGVGHLQGTSLPVGGAGSHSVLTAHRGLASATLFTNLNRVVEHDRFTLEVLGEVFTYEVRETKVVEPDQTEALRAIPGEDLVTLITCTPLGINTQRILVIGERVLPTPESNIVDVGTRPAVPRFPWWALALAGGTAATAAYVWRMGLPVKKKPG